MRCRIRPTLNPEILGDLELDPICYLLVMLELLEQLVKTVLVIRLVDGLPGISVLLLDYLGEMHDLLLSACSRESSAVLIIPP